MPIVGAVAGIASDVRAAYLARLGLEAEPPSVDALRRLHRAPGRAGAVRDPVDPPRRALGRRPGRVGARIAPGSAGRLLLPPQRRVRELLVVPRVPVHPPRRRGPRPRRARPRRDGNHLVLTVAGCRPTRTRTAPGTSTPASATRSTTAPAGAGAYAQGPFTLALDRDAGDVGDWHLTHDPAGGFRDGVAVGARGDGSLRRASTSGCRRARVRVRARPRPSSAATPRASTSCGVCVSGASARGAPAATSPPARSSTMPSRTSSASTSWPSMPISWPPCGTNRRPRGWVAAGRP